MRIRKSVMCLLLAVLMLLPQTVLAFAADSSITGKIEAQAAANKIAAASNSADLLKAWLNEEGSRSQTEKTAVQTIAAYQQEVTPTLMARMKAVDAASVTAAAQQAKFLYDVKGKEATITGVENCPAVLDIPETIDGYTVTAIGEDAFRELPVETVRFPQSVKTIGQTAFYQCTSLTDVFLPNDLQSIMAGAFMGCESLEHVAAVEFANGKPINTRPVFPEALTEVSNGAFGGCYALTAAILPKGVRLLADYTFGGCFSLEVFSTYADNIFWDVFQYSMIHHFFILGELENVFSSATDETIIFDAVYSGSEKIFNKAFSKINYAVMSSDGEVQTTRKAPKGRLVCLGANLRYKATGKLSDVLYLLDEEDVSAQEPCTSDDVQILQVAADGNSYSAVGVGTVRVHHWLMDAVTDEIAEEYGTTEIPIYVTVEYTWWQQLIRILLFGWIWY